MKISFVKNAKDETFTEVLVRYGNKYQMDKAANLQILCLGVRIRWILLLPKSFRLLHGGFGTFE